MHIHAYFFMTVRQLTKIISIAAVICTGGCLEPRPKCLKSAAQLNVDNAPIQCLKLRDDVS